MEKISATIITYNEEKNIERCLKSLQGVADEIIVVDSFSNDQTKEICLKYNVAFFERAFIDYSDQKNFAIGQANYKLILSIDADEELSDQLKKSIIDIKHNWQYEAYSFNRMTNYCGKWIKHTGWYPDVQIRLFDKTTIKWVGIIHEKLDVSKDAICHLKGNLLHYSFYSINQHIAQINRYSDLKAEQLYQKGKKSKCFKNDF